MKLLTKTTRFYLLISVPIFLVAGMIFFFVMHYLLDDEATEQLYIEKQKVLNYLAAAHELPDLSLGIGDEIFIQPTQSTFTGRLNDTMIFVASEKEKIPYRQLIFPATFKNAPYQITIRTTLYENDELLEVIMFSMLTLLAALFISLLLVNRQLSKNLWKPFYETLNRLTGFRLADTKPLLLSNTDIDEFAELNRSLLQLTSKMQRDYSALKEFTENASHELQTPLAIIKSKIELLMQSDGIEESSANQVQHINESISRLSRLNQSLLLLSKIENRQFTNTDSVLINSVVEEKLLAWSDIILHQNIRVETSLDHELRCNMDAALAETLIGNLLSNAIRHNEGGQVRIAIEKESLIISNTGKKPSVPTSEFFHRFKKENTGNDSSGLGLAIVQQICNVYHFKIRYDYSEGWHRIRLDLTSHFIPD